MIELQSDRIVCGFLLWSDDEGNALLKAKHDLSNKVPRSVLHIIGVWNLILQHKGECRVIATVDVLANIIKYFELNDRARPYASAMACSTLLGWGFPVGLRCDLPMLAEFYNMQDDDLLAKWEGRKLTFHAYRSDDRPSDRFGETRIGRITLDLDTEEAGVVVLPGKPPSPGLEEWQKHPREPVIYWGQYDGVEMFGDEQDWGNGCY